MKLEQIELQKEITVFKGIEVKVGNETIKLEGMTVFEFYKFFTELSDDEAKHLVLELKAKLGDVLTSDLMALVLNISGQVEDSEFEDSFQNEEWEFDEEAMEEDEQSFFQPIKMDNIDNFYTFMPNLITEGLDKHSEEFAHIMGLFNSGYTNRQVFTAIESEKQRNHEIAMTELKHKNEIELAKLQMEHELKIAKLQIENAKIQAELAKTQFDLKQLLA